MRKITTSLTALFMAALLAGMLSACGTITDSPEWARAETPGNPALPFNPSQYETAVPDYAVAPDLSNVVNLSQFDAFTDEQLRMLAENHFLVLPTTNWQLFHILETNEYSAYPSFVSSDAVLQLFHIMFSSLLRQTEENHLLGRAEQLTGAMLSRLIEMYSETSDAGVKRELEHCIAYFLVGLRLIESDETGYAIPDASARLADEEMRLIAGLEGLGMSPITETSLSYSQFTVRGHYTRTEDLGRYFRAMMWYGTAAFPLFDDNREVWTESVLRGLLVSYALMTAPEAECFAVWDDIYEITALFSGDSDDLTPVEYWNLTLEVYGNSVTAAGLANEGRLRDFAERAAALRDARIATEIESMNGGAQFRFMGQRYIPDSGILQALTEPIVRPVPSGLDVMAVLGSDRAEGYVEQYLEPAKEWPDYTVSYAKQRELFAARADVEWRSNIYNGWLWSLLPLLEERGEGYPAFMQTDAWTDKSLTTALASWTELRHDTVLYGKQIAAEMGGWDELQYPGYVEPAVELYERLRWVTLYTSLCLSERGLIGEVMEEKLNDFARMLDFLTECSIKELRYEALTAAEYEQIIGIGGWLEHLSIQMASNGELYKWYEIESDTDRNMALVTDIHSVLDRATGIMHYLHEGVGMAAEIYVITPHPDGNLYLTRGAVFDYYEFLWENERLTDEIWQAMLFDGEAPARWDWTKSYLDESETNR